MNEPTVETANQVTVLAGSNPFTSAGTIYMPNVGQSVQWECPYFVRGHTSFGISEIVLGSATLTSFEFIYAIDKNDGNGFGTFKNLSYPRVGGGGAGGAFTITMTDTTGVAVGDYVFGTNVGGNARVVSITNGTTIVVDKPNYSTVSGILRFNQIPNEAISSTAGFKLRVRMTCVTAASPAASYFHIFTTSTPDSRRLQYPLDLVPLTISNLKNPSEVRVFQYGTTTEIAGQENVTSGVFTTDIDATTYPVVDISILSLGYQNTRLLSQSLGSGLTIPAAQVIDRQYQNS
jgi:hypothetical protein